MTRWSARRSTRASTSTSRSAAWTTSPAWSAVSEQEKKQRTSPFRGRSGMHKNLLRAVAARAMSLVRLAVPCAVLSGALFPTGAGAVPLEVYGHLPSVESVALSPDGSRVAYVRTEGDSRVVVIASIAENKMIRWVRVGDEKL